ncbi:hypothetical protein GGX14DRAFT_406694 [Mycena pura]|uniref:Uncharacterized protein n=1 Tax=Mycena pura TaxID=153505 RepID=A0AAD6UPV8_9AGAR|nr:hypothetical protein GGX14DRAFT_406694 [Mycena pura]
MGARRSGASAPRGHRRGRAGSRPPRRACAPADALEDGNADGEAEELIPGPNFYLWRGQRAGRAAMEEERACQASSASRGSMLYKAIYQPYSSYIPTIFVLLYQPYSSLEDCHRIAGLPVSQHRGCEELVGQIHHALRRKCRLVKPTEQCRQFAEPEI